MIERWIVTAEGREPMRPFMLIELEEETWAREMVGNMPPQRWSTVKVWHYCDGEMIDVTATGQASAETTTVCCQNCQPD